MTDTPNDTQTVNVQLLSLSQSDLIDHSHYVEVEGQHVLCCFPFSLGCITMVPSDKTEKPGSSKLDHLSVSGDNHINTHLPSLS